jgi:hypothetical protein
MVVFVDQSIKNLIMKKKPADRHIDVPAEANRDKHINFLALENNDTDPADEPATGKLAADKERDGTRKRSKRINKK